MAYPDFNTQFILTTDASKVAVAAILSQVQDGEEKPISFESRQMNRAQQNYSASEAEMLAVIWATKHYRCYLYGRRFKTRTDHLALRGESDFSAQGPVVYVPDSPAVATDHETGVLQQMSLFNGTHLDQLSTGIATHHVEADVNTLLRVHASTQQHVKESRQITSGLIVIGAYFPCS